MFANCHSAEEVCSYYRSCQLPALLFGGRPCLVTDRDIGLVCMPADLGRLVYEMLESAPVLCDSSLRTFGFLTRPRGRVSRSTWPILGRAGVTIAPYGRRVMLPLAASPISGMRWVDTPLPDRELPRSATVFRVLRTAISPERTVRQCRG